MASITTAAARVVPIPNTAVTIDGRQIPSCKPVAVIRRGGPIPSEAIVGFPIAFAGAPLLALHGKVIDIRESGTLTFRGFIQADTATEDDTASTVEVRAFDALSLLDRVYFGQAVLRGETVLPKDGPWTLGAILSLALGPYSLDANWLSIVGLGSVASLGPFIDQRFPDLRFTGESVLSALRRVIGLVPGASMRARYLPTGGSVIDFYRNAMSARVRNVRIPLNTGPEEGAVIVGWSRQTGSAEVKTRVIAYGDVYRLQVTFREVGTVPASLVGAWPGANPWGDPPTADETAVLANPFLATPGSPSEDPKLSTIFRVYKVPPPLMEVINIDSAGLAIDTGTGEQIPVQVFRPRYVLVPGETAGTMVAEAVSGEFELIEGARLEAETGYLILPRPNVYISGTATGVGGALVKTYARAPLYLTATVSATGQPASSTGIMLQASRGGYDTGQRAFTGIRAIEATGSVYTFVNSDARFWQLGTGAGGIVDAQGITWAIDTIWLDPGTGDWLTAFGVPILDERPQLAVLAEGALQESVRPRSDIRIRLPYLANGWHVGDPFRVLGRGVDGYVFTTSEVVIDMENTSTEVSGSDLIAPSTRIRAR